jgi:hypothetical protein
MDPICNTLKIYIGRIDEIGEVVDDGIYLYEERFVYIVNN